MLDTVVFDLGGTLIEYAGPYAVWPDLETPGFTAAYQHLNQNGWHLPKFEVFKQIGFDMLPVRWQRAAAGEQNLRLADLLADVLQAAGAKHIPADYVTKAAELYESAICAQAEPMANACEVVAEVKAAGFKLGLVSNTMFTSKAHIADMERFGLLDYFDAMVFSADVNKWKPTAAPFLHVLELLGSEGETAVYIGDDPGSDILGGQRAGMRTIHYQSSQRFAQPANLQPDARIEKLTDLLPILAAWR
ncbi:MAG: HAD family hydrolase [Ardenticatenaceae bacterium]|nr:HAD family hydrolase [Ardenticatenaceae bacterium]